MNHLPANISFENPDVLMQVRDLLVVLVKKATKFEEEQKANLPQTYTLDDIAQILHISRRGVKNKIDRGELEAIRGRVPIVTHQQLFKYLKRLNPQLKKEDLFG